MKSAVIFSSLTALAAAQLNTPPGLNANIGINPNPNRNFDPATNAGNTAKFIAATAPTAAATGGPTSVDPATAQAMQLAIRNWMADTTLVSQFQNDAASVNDETQFKKISDGAFKAEVDELTNKAVLDPVIGLDPRVSIANLTLTNGVFQMVVDNLQIMSFQGTAKKNLIPVINNGRCPQVLPSIDTYMIVAAEYIQASGLSGFQARAARPDACTTVNAAVANDATQNPPVPGSATGNPKGTGVGDVTGLAGLSVFQGGKQNLGIQNIPAANTKVPNVNKSASSSAGSAANAALPNQTTQQLQLPGFPNQGPGGSPNGQGVNQSTKGSNPLA